MALWILGNIVNLFLYISCYRFRRQIRSVFIVQSISLFITTIQQVMFFLNRGDLHLSRWHLFDIAGVALNLAMAVMVSSTEMRFMSAPYLLLASGQIYEYALSDSGKFQIANQMYQYRVYAALAVTLLMSVVVYATQHRRKYHV